MGSKQAAQQPQTTKDTIMQAITTKYAGPTNTRGSRIIAKAAAGRVSVGYDHALNLEDNHAAAAQALAEKLGWVGGNYGEIVSGCDHKGDYVHVLTTAVGALRTLTAAVVSNTVGEGNPYTRPAVKSALQTLANIDGHADYLAVDLTKA